MTFTNTGSTPSPTITAWMWFDDGDEDCWFAGCFDVPFVIPAKMYYRCYPRLIFTGNLSGSP